MSETQADWTALIPELPDWNHGRGIDPESWIGCMGNYELAVGYSLIFWPRFDRIGRFVFRHDAWSKESLRDWERVLNGNRQQIEAVINHVHISDIHYDRDSSEPQLRYLGRVLKEAYEAKLARDFPDLAFEVVFNNEPGLDAEDYELSFWQV